MALCSDSMPPLNHDCDISTNTNVVDISGQITYVISNLADRLRAARAEANLRQEELATRAGVSQGTIANLEAGTRKNPRELLSIARALGVQPEWLKTGKGPKHLPQDSPPHAANDQRAPYLINPDQSSTLEHHVSQLGALLQPVDEVRRGAIAELLGALARQPTQADEIGAHIAALVGSRGKKAASHLHFPQ
jgi:transcriptional regulator with XRE-family HTH domain